MKKLLLTLIVPLVFGGSIFAQNHTSHWADFNSGPFEMWDAIVAFIKIDGTYVTDNWEDFEVASFIDGECRGHAFLRMEEDITYPCVELPVYRMDSIVYEEVSFKLFDHVNGIEYVACTSSIPIITGTDYVELYLEDYDYAVVLDFAATVTQTIALTAGEVNYCSFYVDITLADLQTALTDVLGTGSGVSITIKSQTQSSKLTRGRWTGQLTTLDLGKMYKIFVNNDCEITLEGMVVDPAEHQVTIGGGGNPTWIAFPFSASMTLTEAFAGFAVNGDAVKSKTQNANYTRGRWTGQLQTLEPGQGYIYKSASNAADRVFVYPTNNKK